MVLVHVEVRVLNLPKINEPGDFELGTIRKFCVKSGHDVRRRLEIEITVEYTDKVETETHTFTTGSLGSGRVLVLNKVRRSSTKGS